MAKISQSTEIVEYDGTTGEVTKQNTTRVMNFGTEPDYIKLYLQDVLYLSDMPTQYSAALMALLKRTSYAGDEFGMCVILNAAVKNVMCKELGYERRQSLDNVLQKLVKGEILFRVERGIYRLNPYLFGRGPWADIAKIRMEVAYYPGQGRTFQTTIEANKKKNAHTAQESPQEATEAQEVREEPLPGQTVLEGVTEAQEAIA